MKRVKYFPDLSLKFIKKPSSYTITLNKTNEITQILKFLVLNSTKNHFGFYKFYSKINLIGLGYKNFIIGQKLYILLGDCNYIVIKISDNLKVFCRKNQIYTLSDNIIDLKNFFFSLKNIKKINFYKGKGVLEFKNFKFCKLKVGKKQRFS